MKNLCAFPSEEISVPLCKVIYIDDERVKLVQQYAFFLLQMKSFPLPCGKACTSFADMNLYKFLLSHQISVLLYLTPGDILAELYKKIVKVTIICEVVNTDG